MFSLYSVNLFILLFFLPLINAFTKPSILGEVETRIYIGSLFPCCLAYIVGIYSYYLFCFFTPDKRIYEAVSLRGGWNLSYGEFRPKNSCFWSLKPSHKKNTTKMTIIFRETTRGFTKTDFRYLETTWGITIIWLFSNLPYDIALWRAILATFEDENFEVRKILSNFKFIICKKWSFDVTKGGIFTKKAKLRASKTFKNSEKPRFFC